MDQRTLLKKTINLAKTGDAEAFQNFYILTVEETYGKIFTLVTEPRQAEEILVDIYVKLWHAVHTLPTEEEELADRIEEVIYHTVERQLKTELSRPVFDGNYQVLKEETAAEMWMKIEEKAEFNEINKEEPDEKETYASYIYSVLKVIVTVVLLIVTTAIFYRGFRWLNSSEEGSEVPAADISETVRSSDAFDIVESEKPEPGWEEREDGKLYYITKEGAEADGPIPLGKQILTFSRNGELTMIGVNKAVTDNVNLTFNEDDCYEVKEGDIYLKDSSGTESRVVMNGHVVQADARCGYLWFISQYQIPNSSQVKTTIYQAGFDGETQKEVYSTDSTLETGNFQITQRWLYYLVEGTLFRKEISTGATEYLAKDVEYYFAWEDTAYYMKDRTLESVSHGFEYTGTEAGYRIEMREQGLVLLDEAGNPAIEGGNGEVQAGDRIYRLEEGVIRAVSPAVRKNGDVTYYIDEAGADQKIYWKDGAGTGGLIRQEGLTTDSFCIAGEWLYYSARTEQYGEECDSQIYRINLQSMETESSGAPFRGFMKNLYYLDNTQAIYGEYIPSVADPWDIHGELAVISLNGGIEPVNDTVVRPESEGSDMLEMVMAEGERVYCLYHRCSYDSESGQMAWETTIPLEIRTNVTEDYDPAMEIQSGVSDEE